MQQKATNTFPSKTSRCGCVMLTYILSLACMKIGSEEYEIYLRVGNLRITFHFDIKHR